MRVDGEEEAHGPPIGRRSPPMKAIGGIDEAGLGPTLGPLVFGATLFLGERPAIDDLRGTLAGVVERTFDPTGETLGVDDSKRLFAGRRALAPLELPALALLHPRGARPAALDELLGGENPAATLAPWYRTRLELPVEVTAGAVDGWRARLGAALAQRGLAVPLAIVDPVFEPTLNARFKSGLNKADAVLERVGLLLLRLVAAAPGIDVEIIVDRLGGRRYYGEFLRHLFPFRPLAIVHEEPERSRYRLQDSGRTIEIAFEVGGDQNHLPIAWASVCAKYVRELCMTRLNAWFCARKSTLAPTAGYPQDAQRWLAESADVVSADERALLVRER
ncbi:MAG: hypothetical protein EXS13_01795 [Planctomycetes bacterium]|nr:hypothetical protein [Planctomycetota bacterium]